MKKFLCTILCAVMVISLWSGTAVAAKADTTEQQQAIYDLLTYLDGPSEGVKYFVDDTGRTFFEEQTTTLGAFLSAFCESSHDNYEYQVDVNEYVLKYEEGWGWDNLCRYDWCFTQKKSSDPDPKPEAYPHVVFFTDKNGNLIEFEIDLTNSNILGPYRRTNSPLQSSSFKESPAFNKAPAPHVHSFVYGVITEPTKDADGLEGEICTGCGAVRNTQPLSAYGYVLEKYALEKINASKPGQTITLEFGELNSFPKSFMEKLVEKSSAGVTFVFKYMVNHELQTITIPAGTPIDLNFDWYGYAKMAELYGMY